MPRMLSCALSVDFTPLPENRKAAWIYGMGMISALLHEAKDKAFAEAGPQSLVTKDTLSISQPALAG